MSDSLPSAGRSYFDTVRSMTADPEILAAVDRAEAATAAACEHGPDCLRVGCHIDDEPEPFSRWLSGQDPSLGWPVLSWLLWTLCLGMILGWVLIAP